MLPIKKCNLPAMLWHEGKIVAVLNQDNKRYILLGEFDIEVLELLFQTKLNKEFADKLIYELYQEVEQNGFDKIDLLIVAHTMCEMLLIID